MKVLRNGVNCNFMSSTMSFLHSWIVGVFMRDEILRKNKKLIEILKEAINLTVALMLHPFGFFLFPLNISLYKSILLLLMASSKVIVIICGTSLEGMSPGIVVPSSEQKQSGKLQTAGSHGGARFGSDSISECGEWK